MGKVYQGKISLKFMSEQDFVKAGQSVGRTDGQTDGGRVP